MSRRDTPIRRQLITIVLLTSGIVLALTCTFFLVFDYLTFRRNAVTNLQTLGELIATNSTAALAFSNPDDAQEILSALQAERQVVAAALYDAEGRLFAAYPVDEATESFPTAVGQDGYRFQGRNLAGFQPVIEGGTRRLGSLYISSDMAAMYARFRSYGIVVALVIATSLLLAYLISRRLQQQISQPILALAKTARAVSEHRDYSVQVERAAGEELGLLTDAFNHMLQEIQTQNRALVDSEQRMRTVLNTALSAVVVIDSSGRILDWNARAESMFGWSREEALGRDLGDTIVPQQYRDSHRRGLARYMDSASTKVLGRVLELSALHRSGREFPAELFVNVIRAGTSVSFCGFITDITARHEAQSRLQTQLGRLHLLQRITRAIAERQDLPSIFQVVVATLEEKMPVDYGAVLLHDADEESFVASCVGVKGRAMIASNDADGPERMAFLESGLAGCLQGNLYYEPDIREIDAPYPERLSAGGVRSMVAVPLLVENRVYGILVVGRCSESAFSSGDCEFLHQLSEHVALASHETQLHSALQQAYDDLRVSQTAALQQERLKALGQMASGIAHDINNAISPVSLYTESLLEAEPDLSSRARGYLTTIHRAIQDVANTVSRMREFSRAREAQLPFTRLSLNDLVRQVLELTEARWRDLPQERGIQITVDQQLGTALPEISGAASEIRDALTNLIFNAVDAMPDGGTLTIRTRTASAGGGEGKQAATPCVAVEIADTGAGMNEETRQRCLEPFFTTKGERGTGLGLAMVYGMAQRHGAAMEIDSVLGRGTTIRILMPVGSAGAEAIAGVLPINAASHSLRILLVDDDPLVSEALELILMRDGHLVTAANDGHTALGLFAAAIEAGEPFSLTITDLGMPHMDGRKVAAGLKEISPETPVILLTGWGQRILEEGEETPGVDRVLSKPPKLQDLRAALEELTAGERTR